jgi:hypothetical protein
MGEVKNMNGYGSLSFEHIVIMVLLIMWGVERLHNSTLQHGLRMITKMKPKNERMPEWWITEESRLSDLDDDPLMIGCEGCGKYTPLHIYQLTGGQCWHGECVNFMWSWNDYMRTYHHRVDAWKRGDKKAFDDINYNNKPINHDELIRWHANGRL